jgi:hypothetical protein
MKGVKKTRKMVIRIGDLARGTALQVALLFIIVLMSCGLRTNSKPDPQIISHRDSIAVKTSYLDSYFGIQVSPGITQSTYAEYLLKLQPADGGIDAAALASDNASAALKALDGVKYAVIGANLDEVTAVYSETKTKAVLSDAGLGNVSAEYAPYLALALNTGLIDKGTAKKAAANGVAEKDYLVSLLIAVADFNGSSRNFLGYSDEPDIYAKFINAWEAFTAAPFGDDVLYALGEKAVTEGVTTGFNLKSKAYDSRFLPDLTLIYGHANGKHAQQFLALLKSENILAKVAFEPKVSIYEWEGFHYDNEWDLVLEFKTPEDLKKIDALILAYADKDRDNPDKKTLSDSFFTPMYYAHFDVGEGYTKVIDNVITHENYSLHPFSLEADAANTLGIFREFITKGSYPVQIVQSPIWANDSFWEYMGGTY